MSKKPEQKTNGTEMEKEIWQTLVPIGKKEYEINFEIKTLDVKSLRINRLNPNVMDEAIFKALKSNMILYGYNEMIVVAEDVLEKGVYMVLDGAHRAIGLVEQGYRKIPVAVVSGLSRVAAVEASFAYNRAKGTVDVDKAIKLHLFATHVYGEDLARKYSNLDKQKFDEFVRLYKSGKVKMEKVVEDMRKTSDIKAEMVKGKKPLQATEVQRFGRFLLISLPPEDFDFVKSIFRHFDKDDAKAVVMACKELEKLKDWK